MKRLTERDKSGAVNIIRLPDDGMKSIYELLYNTQAYLLNAALNKLADYEDAEEQGRLVRLPFREDTELYVIDDKIIKEGRRNVDKEYVVKGEIDRFYFVNGVVSFDVVLDNSEGTYVSLTSEDIGKTVFLTYEEAEKAVKKGETVGRKENKDVLI